MNYPPPTLLKEFNVTSNLPIHAKLRSQLLKVQMEVQYKGNNYV